MCYIRTAKLGQFPQLLSLGLSTIYVENIEGVVGCCSTMIWVANLCGVSDVSGKGFCNA